MQSQRGISLPELLVVLAVIGISAGVAALNLRPIETPLDNGVALVEGAFRQARLQAIATTSAYRVSPAGSQMLVAETAASCAASTWSSDASMTVQLPDGVSMTSTAWSACFSSRGISTDNIKVGLTHSDYGTRAIEVLLGGTTRVIE